MNRENRRSDTQTHREIVAPTYKYTGETSIRHKQQHGTRRADIPRTLVVAVSHPDAFSILRMEFC